ncbi:MAG TPA: aldo/keto reductase, partial [Tepidisphaeraceae bacterium]|nr:aldo/keto reductase [Tepidisphaeraceae bacterium]
DSIDAIHAAIANGINTIDTAAIYGMGHSEELVAKAIKGKRDKVLIATKCGMRWDSKEGSDPWATKDNQGKDLTVLKNSKPDSIVYECEQSLKRLGIDVIDLYQIHWPDFSTPVEESIRALEKLRQQGKIRAIGVSNYNVEWLQKGSSAGTIASDQPPYSLLNRKIEKDVLPYCREHDIGIIAYSPMERGLLTGKITPDRTFPPSDDRSKNKLFTVENRKKILAALEKIKPIADRHKASFAQLVINWTAHVPGITAAIVGARNAQQSEHNAKALSFNLTSDEMAQIRRAFDETSAALMG